MDSKQTLFSVHTLPSGLKLYYRYRNEPWLGIKIHVHVGSRQAPEDKKELAHIIEHLVFEGRGLEQRRTVAELREYYEEQGWQIIEAEDCETSLDTTSFYSVTPLDKAAAFFVHLNDLVRHADFTNEDVQHAVKVVGHENNEANEFGTDDDKAIEGVYRSLYGDKHLVSIFANTTDLTTITADAANAFFARHYDAPNMSLIVMGGMEEREVVEMVTHAFPPGRPRFRRTRRLPPLELRNPPKRKRTFRTGKTRGSQRVTLKYYWTMPYGRCDGLRLLAYALHDLLRDRLRNEKALLYDVEIDTEIYMDHRLTVLTTNVEVGMERKARKIIAAMLTDEEAILHELPRIKRYAVNRLMFDDSTIRNEIDNASEELLVLKRIRTNAECISILENATDDDIRRLMREFLSHERAVLAVIKS